MFATHTAAGMQLVLPSIVRLHEVPAHIQQSDIQYAPALSFPQQVTAQQAIDALRQMQQSDHSIYYIFVTDYNERLVGVLTLQNLFFAAPGARLFEVMDRRLITLSPDATLDEQAHVMSESGLLALPVLDEQGRLVGAMDTSDLLLAMQERTTSTAYQLAGMSSRHAMDAGMAPMAGYRLLWHSISLGVALLLVFLLSSFSALLSSSVMVAALVPLLLRQSGLGSRQTLTIALRGLSMGLVRADDSASVQAFLKRELQLATLAGVWLGSLAGGIVGVWQNSLALGLLVGGALFGSLLLTALAGVLVPVCCQRWQLNPETVSAGAVWSLSDAGSLLLLLGLGAWLVG